jgi:hypothetical protein
MALDPVQIGNWRKPDRLRIKPAHGTRPVKWLVAGSPTAISYSYVPPGGTGAQTAQVGSTAYAGTGLIGGSRFHLMQAVNTGGANTLKRWLADRLTTVDAGTNTGTVTLTATTMVRTNGSWLTDGFAVDDFVIVDGATTLANSTGAVISAISADGKTLTFPASTFGTAEALPVGATIWRGIGQPLSGLAANAGNAAATPPLNVLTDNNPGVDSAVSNSAFHLGAGVGLFVSLGTALTAGQFVDLTAIGGDF